MSFTNRITRTPRPHNPDRGAEARALFPDAAPELGDLIAGTAGCSPYLRRLMQKEAGWITPAFDAPEDALRDEFARLRETAPDGLATALRQAKRRVALLTALADLGGVWSLMQVTGALSDFADLATHLAMRATVRAEIRRGALPGMGPDDAETAGGMVALAMGKMGAGELNYSSDIDLICLFDETRYSDDDYPEARASLIRATRKACAMLSDITADGYVFRTDLRLRPDPSVTPVCMPMDAAERYYESLGRTWERAAFIKARACAGDIAAGTRFLTDLAPFVWRKHLDFAAIQDAHDMRLAIRTHKGLGGPITLPGHNMKLGRGGIREIEFFTQTRQLIAGGRDPDLRMRGTMDGLDMLAQKGWITRDVATTLTDHYCAHREVEHRLQMVNDAQTHDLPQNPADMARIAAMMDMDTDAFQSMVHARLSDVHRLTEDFFAPDSAPAPAAPAPETTGFDHDILARWPTYPALRTERAVAIFDRLKPDILRRLSDAAKPDEALVAFDGFLAGLPAGVQLFSLFEANPQLVDLIIDVASTSNALAQYLARNASVLDAVIGGSFFDPWPGHQRLCDELAAILARDGDYERQLDATRRWTKEWHFRIGVHLLRGLIDADGAGRQYADLAGATLAGLYPCVVTEFARKHGAAPGRGAVVLGMGSLGAGMQTATSDLDVIVIYDAQGVEASEGRRPLNARAYYARLTQALITAMTAPMAEGKLYEVDMRLRPSGNQGPVATSWQSYQNYQRGDAWTWEHLALTRARVIAGDAGLGHDAEALRCEILNAQRDTASVLRDVADMRRRIAASKPHQGVWDAKIGAGRMQDIELFAQAAALLAAETGVSVHDGLRSAQTLGWIGETDCALLKASYARLWQLQLATRLMGGGTLDPDRIGTGGRAFLLRATGAASTDDLEISLETGHAACAAIIERSLASYDEGGRSENDR